MKNWRTRPSRALSLWRISTLDKKSKLARNMKTKTASKLVKELDKVAHNYHVEQQAMEQQAILMCLVKIQRL